MVIEISSSVSYTSSKSVPIAMEPYGGMFVTILTDYSDYKNDDEGK